MSAFSSVLIFGYDEQLLRTRRWVLERQGYRVWTASSLMTAVQILGTEPIDVMILCQTLSTEDYENAVELARATRPEAGILVMDSDGMKRGASANDTILSDFPTPESLIAAVQRAGRNQTSALLNL